MHPEEEPERPRAVTVIGRLWLVLAGLSLLRSLINLIVWKVIQPAAPSLLGVFADLPSRASYLRPLLEHLTAVMILQATLSIAVGICAYQLLRLRRWARVAVQGVCWASLVYVLCFAALWVAIWTRRFAETAGGPDRSREVFALGAGLAVCLGVAAGLAAMVVLLRSDKVRRAFRERETRNSPSGSVVRSGRE